MIRSFSEIKETIDEKMINRTKAFPYYKTISKFQKNLLQFSMPLVLLIIPPLVNPYITEGYSKSERIGFILSFFFIIGFVVPEYFEQRKGPEGKMDYDIWVWKTGRLSYTIRTISLLLGSLGILLSISILSKMFTISQDQIMFFLIGTLFMALFEFTVIISVTNVNYLFSKFNRYLSTFILSIEFFAFFIALQNVPVLNFLRWGLLIFVTFGFSRAFDKKRLSYNQEAAIKFINPARLHAFIEAKTKIFEIKKKVLDDLKKKYNKQEYQYLRILSEELSKMELGSINHKYNKWVISIPLTVAFFLIASIGEGVVQDLFNDKVKGWFCDNLNILCG